MDEIMSVINTNKNYQIFITTLFTLFYFVCVIFSLQMPFFAKYPNFYVLDKSSPDNKYILQSYSDELCDESKYIIKKDPKTSLHNWAYEYDLYCGRDIYSYLMTNAIFIGSIIGSIVLASFPDKYGREKLFKILIIVSLIIDINILFSQGPIHLIIILFIAGIHLFGQTLCITIASEFVENKNNGMSIGIINGGYSCGGMLFGFFFMLINEWKYYYMYSTTFLIFLTYITLKYLYESPRWLHSMEEKEKCINILDKIAMYNNYSKEWELYKLNNPDIINKIGVKNSNNTTNISNQKNYSIYETLLLKSQRKILILCLILSFTTSYSYFGIVLTLDTMKGGFFANAILAYLGEFIAEAVCGYVADNWGRNATTSWSAFIGTLFFIFYEIFSEKFSAIFLMISMLGFSANYCISELYFAELFPTQIRGNIMSLVGLNMRIAPLFVTLFKKTMGSFINITFIIAGSISFAIVYFGLEETLGKKQTDFVDEENEDNIKELKVNFINS